MILPKEINENIEIFNNHSNNIELVSYCKFIVRSEYKAYWTLGSSWFIVSTLTMHFKCKRRLHHFGISYIYPFLFKTMWIFSCIDFLRNFIHEFSKNIFVIAGFWSGRICPSTIQLSWISHKPGNSLYTTKD